MSLLEEYWTQRNEWPESELRYRKWKKSTEAQRQILDRVYDLHVVERSRENGTQKLREEYDQTKQIKLNIDQTRKDRKHPLEEQEYLTDQTRRRLDQNRNIKNQQNNNNRDTLYRNRPNSEETSKRNKKYRGDRIRTFLDVNRA